VWTEASTVFQALANHVRANVCAVRVPERLRRNVRIFLQLVKAKTYPHGTEDIVSVGTVFPAFGVLLEFESESPREATGVVRRR
jgi:hypothetical protein